MIVILHDTQPKQEIDEVVIDSLIQLSDNKKLLFVAEKFKDGIVSRFYKKIRDRLSNEKEFRNVSICLIKESEYFKKFIEFLGNERDKFKFVFSLLFIKSQRVLENVINGLDKNIPVFRIENNSLLNNSEKLENYEEKLSKFDNLNFLVNLDNNEKINFQEKILQNYLQCQLDDKSKFKFCVNCNCVQHLEQTLIDAQEISVDLIKYLLVNDRADQLRKILNDFSKVRHVFSIEDLKKIYIETSESDDNQLVILPKEDFEYVKEIRKQLSRFFSLFKRFDFILPNPGQTKEKEIFQHEKNNEMKDELVLHEANDAQEEEELSNNQRNDGKNKQIKFVSGLKPNKITPNQFPNEPNTKQLEISDIFIFCLLFNKNESLKVCWELMDYPIRNALLAFGVLKGLALKAKQTVKFDLAYNLEKYSEEWETRAVDVMASCSKKNARKSKKLLFYPIKDEKERNEMGNETSISLAWAVESEKFITTRFCQETFTDIWYNPFSSFKSYGILYTPFMLIYHFIAKVKSKKNILHSLIVKFWLHLVIII